MTREILLTNDDSYTAPGLTVIAQFLRQYGNVLSVAPRYHQSAKSMALTMEEPLYLTKYAEFEAEEGKGSLECWHMNGTPADCAKMMANMCIERKIVPDLFVSGVNHGSNASTAALYSGTLGANKEGCLYGIPSIGLSIDTHAEDCDFSGVLHYAPKILEQMFEVPPVLQTYLNVNFPNLPADQIKGIRFAHQGNGRWEKEFQKSVNGRGREFYWMVGQFVDYETKTTAGEADHILLSQGYITIVPHKLDNTNYTEKERLSRLWKL
ncbi:MAG: 5'/3'-nucleotidase SurE [Bacteroidales bacterium]|nr:5'/3'-nucleotidase SurE [Bacteroidales bacterium]MBR5925089.1 5'/3'-nucleotidase SurE [Bacteroidales bacterium]